MFRCRSAFLVLVSTMLLLTDATTESWRHPVAVSLVGVVLPYNLWLSRRTRLRRAIPVAMAFGDQLLCLAYVVFVPDVYAIAMVASTFDLALAALVFRRRVVLQAAVLASAGVLALGATSSLPYGLDVPPVFAASAVAFAVSALTMSFAVTALAERERRTSDHLARLVEGLGVVVWEYDLHSRRTTFVSQRVEVMLGHPLRRWAEPGFWLSAVHPDDREETLRLRRAGAARSVHDYRVLGQDGRVRWVREIVTRDQQTPSGRLRGIVTDVTDEKLAAAASERRARQDEALLRLSRQAIVETEADEIFRQAAVTLTEVLGLPLVRLASRDREGRLHLTVQHGMTERRRPERDWDWSHSPSAYALRHDLDVLVSRDMLAEERFERDEILVHHDARSAVVAVIRGRAAPYGTVGVFDRVARDYHPDEVSFVRAVASVLAEALARSTAEARLVQAERMEAVGRLAGGIAHDFNNLLTSVYGYTEELRPLVAADETAARLLEQLHGSSSRAAGLARELLTFSRGQLAEPATVDVGPLLHAMQPILEQVAGPLVRLRLDVDAQDVWATLSEDEFQQALLRLVANAREAMPDGGSVGIRVAATYLDGCDAERLSVEPGRYALIQVSDDGDGMPADLARRAFEPFVRSDMTGTEGLALAAVYGTVRRARGAIELETASGRGSSFSLYLPCVETEG